MVERSELERFRLANVGLSRLVRAELEDFFGTLNLAKPEAVRDALLAFVPELTAQYGASAAALAADWYEELRAASGAAGSFRATLADPVSAVAVESQVRYIAGHLWTPEPQAILGPLLTATDKYVKQPGRDTMALNARREGVSWGRVPTGKKTCSFCLVMASRDAVFSSKMSAGDVKDTGFGDDFHGGCDCQVVRIGSPEDYPAEYLPDKYKEMYNNAVDSRNDPEVRAFVDSLDPDDKHKDLKATVFAVRRNNPDIVNDGVHTH